MRRASPYPAGRLAGLVALLGLGGCASFSADGGMSVVKDAAREAGEAPRQRPAESGASAQDVRVVKPGTLPGHANPH